MFGFFRQRRRRKLLAEPFPSWWDAILARNVGHFPRLSPPEQAKLRDTTRVLIAEKEWEGCGGLHITDEMKVTVAAQAALLLIGFNGHDYFARVSSVVVYPSDFRTPQREDNWEDDELSDTISEGQAVYRGPVILSWDHVLAESRDPAGGYNVVVHEFAHQLDFLSGELNGTPPLGSAEAEANWVRVMSAALADHRAELARGHQTFLSEQAGDSETEFFADCAEAFFCNPHGLSGEYREVFDRLADYFRQDPREWFSG
jgi:hypothetical protein